MRYCKLMFLIAGSLVLLISACKSGPKGTYTDANGAVILELRSGGSANFTFLGDVQECTYQTTERQLTVSCKGEAGKTVFNIHDDGSLTGPPGSFMPPLRKQKS